MKRVPLAAALASAAALAVAAPAAADNIAYVGSDGNVWISTTDGARKKQITTDGAPNAAYRQPTQTNDGRILASKDKFFYLLNQSGQLLAGWQAPTGGSFYKSPGGSQISPDGGLVTWWYYHNTWVSDPIVQRVAFQTPDGGTPSPCTINCHDGYRDPRWIPGTPNAAMITTSGNGISVQNGRSLTPWAQTDGDFEGFDVSRTGNRIAIVATVDGQPAQGQHQQGVLQVFQGQGPPPAAASLVCQAAIGDETSQPRWSPNGSGITWSDHQGVWVSPAPTAGGNGACNLQPRLLAPGAKSPDWGQANVPADPTPPPPDPDPDPDPGPGPGPGPGPDPDPEPGPGPGPDPDPDPGPGPGPDPDPTDPSDPGTPENPDNPDNGDDNGSPKGPGDGPKTPEVPKGPETPDTGDKLAPQITGVALPKAKLAAVLSRGYGVSFATSEAGTATLTITASGSTAKGLRIVMAKSAVVATGGLKVAGAGKYKVVAKFSKKAKARLKKLRSVRLTATLTFADAAGNTASANRKLTLKR